MQYIYGVKLSSGLLTNKNLNEKYHNFVRLVVGHLYLSKQLKIYPIFKFEVIV